MGEEDRRWENKPKKLSKKRVKQKSGGGENQMED